MHTRTAIIAIIGALTTAGLAACTSGQTVSTTPDKPVASSASKTSAAPKASAKPKPAAVGDTLTLKGQEDGEQLAVTLKKWVDPAKPSDEFMAPQSGQRWVAGQFELKNTGTATYSDSPGNGAQVADSDGQRFQSTISGGITAGPEMTSDLKLPVGEKALGWIVFEVPKASKISTVQFTMNSGFAEQTGQWSVK